MAKSVTALKDIMAREEKLLAKLQETLKLMAHKESKAIVREIIKNKRADIRAYKAILKASARCPAVVKPSAKKPAAAKKSRCRPKG
ncbi:MAG: hypothetical protein ACE5EI_08605 [Thermodesulfobacteriota bacterium]